jgi:hypothetical protein
LVEKLMRVAYKLKQHLYLSKTRHRVNKVEKWTNVDRPHKQGGIKRGRESKRKREREREREEEGNKKRKE